MIRITPTTRPTNRPPVVHEEAADEHRGCEREVVEEGVAGEARERRPVIAGGLEPALTPGLISKVLREACTRIPNLTRTARASRLERLMETEAWIDTAFSLIELELPMWRPRRLVYDSGEWLCSLSRHSEVPIEVDATADGRHETLAIAILLTLVEAKRLLAADERLNVPSVPPVSSQKESRPAVTISDEPVNQGAARMQRRVERRVPADAARSARRAAALSNQGSGGHLMLLKSAPGQNAKWRPSHGASA